MISHHTATRTTYRPAVGIPSMESSGRTAPTNTASNWAKPPRSSTSSPHSNDQDVNPAWLTGAVHDVLRRVVQLAEHYHLHDALRVSIETHYRRYQHDGYMANHDQANGSTVM